MFSFVLNVVVSIYVINSPLSFQIHLTSVFLSLPMPRLLSSKTQGYKVYRIEFKVLLSTNDEVVSLLFHIDRDSFISLRCYL